MYVIPKHSAHYKYPLKTVYYCVLKIFTLLFC